MISVAAELAEMHPQTLRMYEARGLIEPKRSPKGTRLYSHADVERLRRIQELTSDGGMNLAGVEKVFELEEQLGRMQRKVGALERRAAELEAEIARLEEVRREVKAEIVRYESRSTELVRCRGGPAALTRPEARVLRAPGPPVKGRRPCRPRHPCRRWGEIGAGVRAGGGERLRCGGGPPPAPPRRADGATGTVPAGQEAHRQAPEPVAAGEPRAAEENAAGSAGRRAHAGDGVASR